MKIVLKKPANCQVVSQTTEAQQTFMETAGKRDAGQNLKIDWLNLVKQGDDNTNPAPVSFAGRLILMKTTVLKSGLSFLWIRTFKLKKPSADATARLMLTVFYWGRLIIGGFLL